MLNREAEQELSWIDNLRVISLVAVIFLHVSAGIPFQFGKLSNFIWWTGNIYDSAVRFCVPIFVMITGALLLPKNYVLSDFLKKRLFRVILPFIFWSAVYLVFNYSLKIIHGENLNLFDTLKWVFYQVINGSSYHLWYIYMIIGIYLIIPIIGKWVRQCSEKEILYFLGIWIFTLFINIPGFSKLKTGVDLTYFSGYLGYLILGYYLSIKTFNNKIKVKTVSILLILTGTAITSIGTYYLSDYTNAFYAGFYSFLTPNVLITAIGIFMLVKNRFFLNVKKNKLFTLFVKHSYGIYLVHVIILTFLAHYGIDYNLLNPIAGIPLTTIICLVISGGIIYLLNKLPYGKYISG